jgi:hypothetical protein
MLLHLDDYRKARALIPALDGRSIAAKGPRPDCVLLALPCLPAARGMSPELPAEHAAIEPEFMDRVYALASQI